METTEIVSGSSAGRPEPRRPKDRQKSKIGNGAWLSGVDGRSAWIRRCRELYRAYVSDLGGEENTSTAERSLVRRSVTMEVELERMELMFALAGEASGDDLDVYSRIAGNLRRMLESVGLERRAKDVSPTLSDLLREDQELQRRQARDQNQPLEEEKAG